MSRSADEAPAPEPVDGRRRRGQDNRARIVAAMMAIIHDGNVAPSAEQVADRADVGLRTVFRHFQDMDSLYREIAQVVGAQVRAILDQPVRAQAWADRVLELVGRRAQAFEQIAPYKRAADVFRHRSKFLGSDYTRLVTELRQLLVAELPPAIMADPARLEALDLLMSFEAWSRLRREQDLPVAHAQEVVEAAVRRLIG
ncbi:TetR family transcriptional regulator [Phenylobacterium sp.]|uniref:TetR/AcrR family transcriptional regulator n=1 Tax=Phenylobacterium sp. TaxID=1871053 RepID=UPI0025F50CA8|nr:TetR family transcriptional regulator [Phenylobacterium sp.]